MPVLLNGQFWAGALNEMIALQPGRGQAISRKNAARIREIGCLTLTILLNDPEFDSDLARARALVGQFSPINARAPNYAQFIDEFMRVENRILADEGVDTVASRHLEQEILGIAPRAVASNADDFKDRIVFLRKLACEGPADPARPLWKRVLRGVCGVGIAGIDASAVAVATPLATIAIASIGTAAVFSGGVGYNLLVDALKGRW
jgi:hypothetical protein